MFGIDPRWLVDISRMLSQQPPPVGRVGKTRVLKQKRLSRKARNRKRR